MAVVLIGIGSALLLSQTLRSGAQDDEKQPPQPSNNYCLLCHRQPDRTLTFASGETVSLAIDPQVLAESVHGEGNPDGALACVDCHPGQRFPHAALASQTLREFKLERYASCRSCHEEQYLYAQDSVHGSALRAGQIAAAVCVDCHGGHDIQPPDQPRQRISFTCGQCHGAIFEEYQNSIHGKALIEEGNPDVPTCIDCHGVHNIQNPTTTLFRVRSPELCARCHANDSLMAKYDISTDVFDSYLTDFHGTTVALFEQQDPEVATNKAVCYDCHGVHNISAVRGEAAHNIRENLLVTCQKCHPSADANFPDAWIGHYKPTVEDHPLLFGVKNFYRALIPLLTSLFGLLIVSDLFRRLRQLRGR
jgi:predicted CXXCH cytochrome family protein